LLGRSTGGFINYKEKNIMVKVIEYYVGEFYLSVEETDEDGTYIMEMGQKEDRDNSNGFMVTREELVKITTDIGILISK